MKALTRAAGLTLIIASDEYVRLGANRPDDSRGTPLT